jgi:hypothetical protein
MLDLVHPIFVDGSKSALQNAISMIIES